MQDNPEVNTSEDDELQYWTKKFGVSADELKKAVEKVGSMAADVEKELGN